MIFKKLFLAVLLFAISISAFSTTYYIAPNGDDLLGTGTILLPFQTIQKVHDLPTFLPGDTIYARGGTYMMTEAQIKTKSSIFAYFTNLTKSGASGRRYNIWAYPGERPVFDFTNVKPVGYRVYAFEVGGSWYHFKGLEVVGVQVTITNANTQSICFENQGSNNIYEQLSMHDGQAIGFFLQRGANNLILNCDAYRNNDYTSLSGGGVNGGNVDGFGNHPNNAGYVNNVFKGCRAWFNSDDGYDCISAEEPTIFDSCWAFYNGYAAGFISRGDGNGFKAGGYGSSTFDNLPANIPRNIIRNCLSVRNKTNGFYSNHHLSGSDWYNNTAYMNSANFNMLNRKAKDTASYLIDVPGYNHVLKNNISLAPRTSNSDIINYDAATCVITNNTFLNSGVTVTTNDFVSIDTALLMAPRNPDGSLPTNGFLRLKPTSALVDKGTNVGLPFYGAAPDLGCFEVNPSTFPVEVVTFTASVVNNAVQLNWQTATEMQNRGWEIERATGGDPNAAWEKVGFVVGQGNSQKQNNYIFTDKVVAGRYQYRLKQLDFDGNYKYSPVRTVNISKNGLASLSVFPNPVTTKSLVNYTLAARTRVQLALYTADGKLVSILISSWKEAGQYQVMLEKNMFPAVGSFVLKLSTEDNVVTKAITKAN